MDVALANRSRKCLIWRERVRACTGFATCKSAGIPPGSDRRCHRSPEQVLPDVGCGSGEAWRLRLLQDQEKQRFCAVTPDFSTYSMIGVMSTTGASNWPQGSASGAVVNGRAGDLSADGARTACAFDALPSPWTAGVAWQVLGKPAPIGNSDPRLGPGIVVPICPTWPNKQTKLAVFSMTCGGGHRVAYWAPRSEAAGASDKPSSAAWSGLYVS